MHQLLNNIGTSNSRTRFKWISNKNSAKAAELCYNWKIIHCAMCTVVRQLLQVKSFKSLFIYKTALTSIHLANTYTHTHTHIGLVSIWCCVFVVWFSKQVFLLQNQNITSKDYCYFVHAIHEKKMFNFVWSFIKKNISFLSKSPSACRLHCIIVVSLLMPIL